MRATDATRLYFDRAADRLDLSESIRKLLLTAKREVSVQIAVELERLVETVKTTIVVAFLEPGDAEIVKILRWVYTAVNRLIEFFNRLVESTLR